jgi:hypothetical protein
MPRSSYCLFSVLEFGMVDKILVSAQDVYFNFIRLELSENSLISEIFVFHFRER